MSRLRGIGGLRSRFGAGRATLYCAIAGAPGDGLAAQGDACPTRMISRASSAAVQADSRTPSREAHRRRASGPLPALTQAEPKFHAG